MTQQVLTKTSLDRAASDLAKRDKDLGFIFKTYGPPPLWARPPGFSTLIKIILEQQVSLASAASIFARLKQNTVPFRPERIAELGEPHLKSLGLTRQKTAYCLHLSQSVIDRRLKLAQLARLNDADVRSALMDVKGLGAWSADVYLLMALRRPDVWPASDLALAVALTKLKRLNKRPTPDELSAAAEPWRPFRSVAARMLWQYYLAQREATRKSNGRQNRSPGGVPQ